MSSERKKIAILASGNMLPDHPDQRGDVFELEEEMSKLIPAFDQNGMDVELLDWRDIAQKAQDYDAVLPLLVWDYFEGNERDFIAAMAITSQNTKIFNDFSVLTWNMDKSYLEELGKLGAPTIPSITTDWVSEARVLKAIEQLGSSKVVIKPVIGGGAWRQVLYEKGQPFPSRDELPPGGALIQPYLHSVTGEGEYSFLYFGNLFSHAVLKRPQSGDYRVQSIYGGSEEAYTPTKIEREQGRAVLDVLEFTPLYARVDFIRDNHGSLRLIELEMIEPYLYLNFAPGDGGDNEGAQKLAKALAKKLDAPKIKSNHSLAK